MRAPKVDPKLLEHEYVTTDVSIRELAKKHDMSWSAIATRSRNERWTDKRAAYRDSLTQRTYERTTEKFAVEAADIRTEMIQVNRATLARYVQQLSEDKVHVTPKDAVAAIASLLNLMGEPTSRTETQIVDFTQAGGFGRDELRQLVELARARIVEGTATSSDESEPSRTRPN